MLEVSTLSTVQLDEVLSQRHLTQYSCVPIRDSKINSRTIGHDPDGLKINKYLKQNKTNKQKTQTHKQKTLEEEQLVTLRNVSAQVSRNQDFPRVRCEHPVLLNPGYCCKTNISIWLHTVFIKHLRIICRIWSSIQVKKANNYNPCPTLIMKKADKCAYRNCCSCFMAA